MYSSCATQLEFQAFRAGLSVCVCPVDSMLSSMFSFGLKWISDVEHLWDVLRHVVV